MLIYTKTKSKKNSKTKKQIAEYNAWLASVNSQKTDFSRGKVSNSAADSRLQLNLSAPPGRETKTRYPSLNSGYHDTYKKETQFYTGDKMKGIGTLHKSNAVPIFTDEEAKDQASMRR